MANQVLALESVWAEHINIQGDIYCQTNDMNSHELANKLLALPDREVMCLGNTEEFTPEEVGDWNGEFIYVAIHHVEVDYDVYKETCYTGNRRRCPPTVQTDIPERNSV